MSRGASDSAELSVEQALRESVAVHQTLLARELQTIARVADLLVETFQAGNRLFLFGNGSSAADAQHVAAELVGRFERERRAVPSLALTTDTSIISALSNDFSFYSFFARQVQAFVRPGDVVAGISTSGNSKNVLAGLEEARRLGATTVGFTGQSGGRLPDAVDICLCVPSDNTARIQEGHLVAWHAICQSVEQRLFAQ